MNGDNSSCECGFDYERYIPDAICVIPACHMDDGKARWCALRDCDDAYAWCLQEYLDEDLGKMLMRYIYIESLKNCSAMPLVTYDEDTEEYSTKLDNNWIYGGSSTYVIPSLRGDISDINFVTARNNTPLDYVECTPRKYKDIDNDDIKIDICQYVTSIGPWLYNDGTYEEGKSYGIKKYKDAFMPYYNINNIKYLNILSNLDGYDNTQKIIEYCKLHGELYNYNITNSVDEFKQNKQLNHDWYIPSAGELAYLLARWYVIQASLYKLSLMSYQLDAWWPIILPFSIMERYWSSTPTIFLDTTSGYLKSDELYGYYNVRLFRAY